MTIGEYYLTFGYHIDIEAYKIFKGYTVENITDEIRQECKAEDGVDDNESVLEYWFRQDMNKENGYVLLHRFTLNNIEFVVRGYTHNNKKSNHTLVIGVDVGTINRWSGEVTLTGNNNKHLGMLTSDPVWRKFLIKHGSSSHYGECEYKIGKKNSKSYMLPSVYTTTNDCDCCS